jgi:predicted RecB family nuclease
MAKARREYYLTKSRFMAGLNCSKRLWLDWHEPTPIIEADEETAAATPQDTGTVLGIEARKLFAGGVLIDDEAWQHKQAVKRTKEYLSDKSVPAIFEAAFENDRMRVRIDVLERLPRNRWRLWEVKSSKAPKDEHLIDLAFQAHVLKGEGLRVPEIGVIHVNGDYVRGNDGIDWKAFFARTDVTKDIQKLTADISAQAAKQFSILRARRAPTIEPSKHCDAYCAHWDGCTKDKPEDWIINLPRLSATKFAELHDTGIEAITEIQDPELLTKKQQRVWQAHLYDKEFISPDLREALKDLGPPAYHLDFETMNPAVPLYPGTSPYEVIPFQWSIHRLGRNGAIKHYEFLADGQADPRRELAETLLSAVSNSHEPILMYTSYERTVIRGLIKLFPDLAKPLDRVIDRLRDLKAVVEGHFYSPKFMGSYSLKAVGPALASDVNYAALGDIADGMAAAKTFEAIAFGSVSDPAEVNRLRQDLLLYCQLDTYATVEVQKALRERCSIFRRRERQ